MTVQELVEYIKQSEQNKCFYHFTDEVNLPSIMKHGILSTTERNSQNIEPCFRGGNAGSHRADKIKKIEKYVCLSFTIDHSLCFKVKQQGRLSKPIKLKISPEILLFGGVMFADGVANARNTKITPIADAIDLIDTEVIYEGTDWDDSEIKTRLNLAKKCEILVPNFVPVEMIMSED